MVSRVNLVAFLLTLGCLARALENARSAQEDRERGHRGYPVGKKHLRDVENKIVGNDEILTRSENRTKMVKTKETSNAVALSKDNLEGRDRPRKRRRKMNRTLMALLMAYKMKFIALIPTMLGGLILLKATALLAGFFFALFAAVLGLKIH